MGRASGTPAEPGGHALGFHQGEVLFRLSNTYDTLLFTLIEAVQNAVDACAENVYIGIDIKNRMVVVYDDGTGVTVGKFQEALLSVGKGIKKPGSLGRFGLGLISPLNKCRVFNFYSAPLGERRVNHWTFVGEEIRTQHEAVLVPFEYLTGLPRPPAQFVRHMPKTPRWRTVVRLEGVTTQKVIGLVDLDELEANIRTKLGHGMRLRGTTVHVTLIPERGEVETREINPSNFTGEALPVVVLHSDDSGEVRFELYRAPKDGGRRRGEVLVMQLGDNYPIRFREFQGQAWGTRWLKDVKEAFDALASGFFEGTIYIQNVELDPTRTKFVLSDALYAAFMVIDQWFRDHGQELYEQERNTRRGERYQDLGEQSLERILRQLRTDPALARMARGLAGLLPDVALPEASTTAPVGSASGSGSSTTSGEGPEGEGRRRLATANPGGKHDAPPQSGRRRRKSGDDQSESESTGGISLSFAYEEIPLSLDLFVFNVASGVLTFNILHHTWVSLDETGGKHTAANDKQIMALQEWLTFKVLYVLSRHGLDELEERLSTIMHEAEFYAAMIIKR